MKKFLGLLQNELIKIWKQTGYRVMLFVLIGLSLVTPLLGLLTTIDFSETPQEEYELYMEWAQEEEDDIWCEWYTALAEVNLFFIENDLGDSWKYSYFINDYEALYIRAYTAQLIESGKIKLGELEEYPFEQYFYDYSYPSDGSETVEPESKYEIPTYAEAKAELDALAAEILNTTERDVTLGELERQRQIVEIAEQSFESTKLLYEANPNNAQTEYQFMYEKETLDAERIKLEACQAIFDNSAPPSGWQYSMLSLMKQSLSMMIASLPMPEELYDGDDYDAYLSQCDRNYDYYYEAVSVFLHSIKTDNCISPISDSSMLAGLLGGVSFGVSTKTQLRSAIISFISLITILMIVLASGVISTEFSSGTIRLLVIRPCSRRQIIASKLAAVGVVYVVLTAVMSFILTLESVLLFGVGDLFAPDTVFLAGRVVDLPFFVMTLERIAVSSLVALAYVSIAIILASLTRKNGLAITMSMLLYAFVSTVATIAVALAQIFPNALGWLIYTPFTYMSLISIVPPAHELMSGIGGMYGLSGAMLWLGVLYHAVFIVGMVYLTVLAFRKKQIKN